MNNIHNWLFQKQLAEDLQGGTAPNPMGSPMAPPQMQPRITVHAPDSNVGMMDNTQPTPMQQTGNQFPLSDVAPRPVPEASPWARFKAGMSELGSGLSGYTRRLFNDPARMALLQGGLSMMDPNTYYDKQGFGSPWTGLRVGLGAAQQGMKGVYDRRKQLADIDKTKADALLNLQGGRMGEYRTLLARFRDPMTPASEKEHLGRRLQQLEGVGQMDQYMERSKQKYIYDKILPDADQLESSLNDFVNTMASTIDTGAGIITGPGVNPLVSFSQFLQERLGQDLGATESERLRNTKTFMSRMGSQVGQIIKQFGSGTGLSDADREFAKMIAGADPSEFNEESLKRVLALSESRMRMDLHRYNERIRKMHNGNPPDYLLKEMPQMSQNFRNHIVSQRRLGKFKQDDKPPIGWVDSDTGEWDALHPASAGGGWSATEIR